MFLAQQRFTEARGPETPDALWALEHDPVYTQGQAGRAEHVLAPGTIPVVSTDRGGQVTYHGPGQLVIYLLVDCRRRGLGVRALVDAIEGSLIDALAGWALKATRVAMPRGFTWAGRRLLPWDCGFVEAAATTDWR